MATTHPDTPRNRGDHDAPHMSPVTPAEDARTIAINKITWGAVFAGVAVALITQLLLNMIGLGVGLATLDPATGDNPSSEGLSMGAAIWWIVSGIVASFVGGWVAGRVAGTPKESTGGWHGVTSWAVTSLIVIYLLTSAVGSVLGGAMGAIGGAARTAGTAAASGQGDEMTGALKSGVESATGLSLDQAQQQASNPSPETRQRAARAADTAATAASTASLVSAFALILGAFAAWFGGRRGTVDPTVTPLARV